MAIAQVDRVGELLEGARRERRTLLSPEGVPLDIRLAGRGERLTAFALDMTFMGVAIGGLYALCIPLFFSRAGFSVGMTLILFVAFIVRNLYFLHFELAWQGRTPGKRICGLRVIDRHGGELTPSAVIARNLTREVEVFLPLSLFLSLDVAKGGWQQLTLLGWVLGIAALPLFNRDRLRAGDLIGGTQVISMPKRVLLDDLSAARNIAPETYAFTHEQLSVYGAFELQVLEELLRRPASPENERLLADVCAKICRKTGWKSPIPPQNIRRFLNDFYTAERADLERGRLFGRFRADKNSGNTSE